MSFLLGDAFETKQNAHINRAIVQLVVILIPSTIHMQHEDNHAEFAQMTDLIIPRQSPIPTIRALLIGIDTYKNFTPLSGAVKDVQSMYGFLRSDLSVPESRITRLTNEQATRSGIINAMRSLCKDPTIKRFDPIIIFYAGHGCEVESPFENYREKAQCLVPWDMGRQGMGGHPVSPIPDYTISTLLDELASKKGNNITVIFDSCHSASSTRGVRQALVEAESKLNMQFSHCQSTTSRQPSARSEVLTSDCRVRSLNLQDIPLLTLETDKEIVQRAKRRGRWKTILTFVRSHLCFMRTLSTPNETGAKASIPQKPLKKAIPELIGFSRSHVLLAACGRAQQAYECAKCNSGYFTSTLLWVLRSRLLEKLKYKQCFEEFPKLKTPNPQSPVCEGSSINRVFFKVPPRTMAARTVSFNMQQLKGHYFLNLGEAQGVFPGSKYAIYEDSTIPKGLAPDSLPSPGLDRPLWGYFTAEPCMRRALAPYPLYSDCKLDEGASLPSRPRAKLVKLGHRGAFSLRVFVSDALKLILDPSAIVRAKQGMMLAESQDTLGTAILDVEDGHGGNMTFGLVGFPGVLYRCYPDAKTARRILISMAQWTWHRSRVPQLTSNRKIMAKLTLYELGEAGASPLPVGHDGSTSIKLSPTALYALKVTSLFPKRLYAYLFYFSTLRQSIRPLYLGIYGSSHIDPALEPSGELCFGYNNDDMIPGALSFDIAPDEGYFQLFLTTLPGDFDSIAQQSPFIQPQTAIDNEDDYGDGLEIRKYNSSESGEAGPSPFATIPSGTSGGRSADILVAQAPKRGSVRRVLPEGVRSGPLEARASQWGVVSLKVKCCKPDA
ncbi:unnamed protein product [Rhizoctonia solani]|uniref:Peptidase C14 caspase domain-containing protein n=1 Tax=Rhizoctonia solani TaxID=456999 RepID=A0A8H3I383_9AGAM|nr:unnamed protein product [Rhizoctonia solani]